MLAFALTLAQVIGIIVAAVVVIIVIAEIHDHRRYKREIEQARKDADARRIKSFLDAGDYDQS